MPRLWNSTIVAHRESVREAILDATSALVAENGLLGVTMSQIAEQTGIGRATLYKYFSDVGTIVRGWHERQINAHLAYLVEVRDRTVGAGQRLEAVLEAYALLSHDFHGHHDADLAAFLHRDEEVAQAHRGLHDMIRKLLAEGTRPGAVRDDVAPDELASFSLHALAAARDLRSEAAVRRLVSVTLAGLSPMAGRAGPKAAPNEIDPDPTPIGGADRHDHKDSPHARPVHGASVEMSRRGRGKISPD